MKESGTAPELVIEMATGSLDTGFIWPAVQLPESVQPGDDHSLRAGANVERQAADFQRVRPVDPNLAGWPAGSGLPDRTLVRAER